MLRNLSPSINLDRALPVQIPVIILKCHVRDITKFLHHLHYFYNKLVQTCNHGHPESFVTHSIVVLIQCSIKDLAASYKPECFIFNKRDMAETP